LANRRRQDRAGRALAEFLFDDDTAMVRLDMSEYMEKFSVSRWSARLPVRGYEEGGQLTEAIRRRRTRWCCSTRSRRHIGRVQHPAAGPRRRAPDRRQGRTVDFRNTVLIMTSNVGSQYISGFTERGDDGDSERRADA